MSAAGIYLDNAATSFPKPECVYQAVDHYNRQLGAAVGRGAYRQAIEVQREIDRCRQRAARLLNASLPEQIVFTFNGTDSLNSAIHGLLRPGDHVVASVVEHNSVLRTLRELERHANVEVTLIDVNGQGFVDPDEYRRAIRTNTRLMVLTHASNVTGAIQPCAEVGRIAREASAAFLVDAAQTAGHIPIDVQELSADLLACPGHKGLLGPLGTGLLYVGPGMPDKLRSTRQGGTGTRSEVELQPETLPDKYESGNHNAPGLFGLSAALDWLQGQDWTAATQHADTLTALLLGGLADIPGVEIHGPPTATRRVSVVSFSMQGQDPQIISTLLDQVGNIQSRAGLHCAPGAHRALRTLERGGTVRLSPGRFNTAEEISQTIDVLRQLAESL